VKKVAFENRASLRVWLEKNHDRSPGMLVMIYKAGSGRASITFQDLLEEGLCFGWSESTRQKGDDEYYLQAFTPRRRRGTASKRNRLLVKKLVEQGRMTDAGLAVL
jgi:uncharacterized protein YdeI (YjbR/CyaY-like superfamily)